MRCTVRQNEYDNQQREDQPIERRE
jgi:hypothetical protein